MKKFVILFLGALLVLSISACQKIDPENPYDNLEGPPPDDGGGETVLDPNTIQGIHQNILLPTCANSGCHDGTFEPDFRSVESAYNTMVGHPAIKVAPGPIDTRVVPGDADNSILWFRLNNELGGTEKMPIVETADWLANKTAYLNNIRTWINNGAKDQFGN